MAFVKLGEVKSPSGEAYKYYWDSTSGDVLVSNSPAGKAANESEAWKMANFFATTGLIMKK
jgi:hypothetical protein